MFTIIDSAYRSFSYKSFKFSGGEIQVRIDPKLVWAESNITITAKLHSSDTIMELILLMDAIRRMTDAKLHLIAPYLPYARQDRVMTAGEALSLRVMCDIINSLNFASVTVWDVHSDVTLALLNRVNNIPQEIFLATITSLPDLLFVAPDGGALKKITAVSKHYNREFVRADKKRDPKTGEITGTVVYSDHVGDKNFLIVDDICDGGRTFIELAKVLRPLTTGKVYLYVTHGIFSQGLDVFDGIIDHVYTANLFNADYANDERITVL